MVDGSIVFDTRLDNSDLEKSLQSTIHKIENLKAKISQLQAERLPLVDQAQQLGIELDAAKEKLYEMQTAANGAYSPQSITDQQTQVAGLQTEWDGVQRRLDTYDASIQKANIDLSLQEDNAGAISERLDEADTSSQAAGDGISLMCQAIDRATSGMDRFLTRIKNLATRVLFFSLITMALRSLRSWISSTVQSNNEAAAAIARLKAALLTLAQPIMNVVIPAFVQFINILTSVISAIAQVVSLLFGTTFSASKKSAEQMSKEKTAISGVGGAAAKATKQLAAFDEINQLSDNNAGGGGGGGGASGANSPDFAGLAEPSSNWLSAILGKAAGWVTAALMLAGIALIAIGAATGRLGLILAGLLLLAAGIYVGKETGVLQSWVDTLGLKSVPEFVAIALILAGIAMVAIGAALGKIGLVLAGLLMIGGGIYSAEKTGVMADWAKTLGLSRVAEFVTAALLLGGIALVAIGAAQANVLTIAAGLGLLAAGVYVGYKSETLQKWADALGINSVFGYVAAGIQLAGIALIGIGAATATLALVIAGAAILSVGIAAEAIGQQTLQSWWETLKLTNVQQWVSVAMTLGGIALVAVGAATANIMMLVGGMALIGLGVFPAAAQGNLQDWVKTLGLEKATEWVTAGLLIGGIAFIVVGILTANVLMILAGVGILGAGISVGSTSGTFKKWWDVLNLPQVAGWVTAGLLLAGIAFVVIGIITVNIPMIIGGVLALHAGVSFGTQSGTLKNWWDVLGLSKVAKSVSDGLKLGGIGLVALGIATANVPMLVAGLTLLGAKAGFSISNGTFKSWVDTILTGLKQGTSDIQKWWAASVAPKLTLAYWKDKFKNIGAGLIQKIKDGVNGGIALFNRFVSWVNGKLHISWQGVSILGKQIIPAGNMQLLSIPSIPYLAQGAVIPPNRAFAAVLGDQSTGNNLEAPEALIRKIVREESGGGNTELLQQILQAIKDGKVLVCDKYTLGRVVQSAVANRARQAGTAAIAL